MFCAVTCRMPMLPTISRRRWRWWAQIRIEKFDRFDPDMVVKRSKVTSRSPCGWHRPGSAASILRDYRAGLRLCRPYRNMMPEIATMRCRASTTYPCGGTTSRRCARKSPGSGCLWPLKVRSRSSGDPQPDLHLSRCAGDTRPLCRKYTWKSPEHGSSSAGPGAGLYGELPEPVLKFVI